MKKENLVVSVPLKAVMVLAFFAGSTAAGVPGRTAEYIKPKLDTWTQTDWSGDGGVNVVSDPEEDFNDYREAFAVHNPFNELSVGVFPWETTIDPRVVGVRDLALSPFGYAVAAADIELGGDVFCSVFYADLDHLDETWYQTPPFPPNGYGDSPVRVNSIEVTYDGRVFAGVEMERGYAGVYSGAFTGDGFVGGWEYLGGPGNPEEDSTTATCTDIISLYGLSDQLLIATGDAGIVFYYDGDVFVPFQLPGVETVYGFYQNDPFLIKVLTGPNGLAYHALKVYPTYWEQEEWAPLAAADLLTAFSYGNYTYIGTANPASVYVQTGYNNKPEVKGDLRGNPSAVYSLGHVGNLIIAGSGPQGFLYGSRDTGVYWSVVNFLGPNTYILKIYDLGSFAPDTAIVCAVGVAGGMYLLGVPDFAYLESSALDVGVSDSTFGEISWDAELNGGEVKVKVRTFNAFDEQDEPIAPGWDEIPFLKGSGVYLEDAESVHRGDKYLQYYVSLTPSDSGESPVLHEINLEYGALGFDRLLPEEDVYAYPNPVTGGTCRFYFGLSEAARVTVDVYDLKGRLVWTRSREGKPLDTVQYIEWDTGDVAPDVYVFRVSARTDGGSTDAVVKKLAVLK